MRFLAVRPTSLENGTDLTEHSRPMLSAHAWPNACAIIADRDRNAGDSTKYVCLVPRVSCSFSFSPSLPPSIRLPLLASKKKLESSSSSSSFLSKGGPT